ncbi:MAG: branched-chain amino acid ABC transporter substrate-binding protein [Caenispirillum sp.]|nr:branched-chain amino acid ABC transporter substrate-binding protein [Caenispirillum sp.]
MKTWTKTASAMALAAAGLAATAAAAQAEIRIAVAGPMTGQYAAFGAQMRDGAQKAVEDLNAAGGVLGEQVVLEVGDDACDPRQAVAVANQLSGRDVVFVAGHWCSGSSIPASAVYEDGEVVMISPGSTNPGLTEQGFAGVFRVCGRDDQQGEVAAAWIADTAKDQRIAILHDKTAYGRGLADATRGNLNKLGVTEVLYDSYTAGEKDYSALVTKLKQLDVDLLYIGGYHTETGLILRQLREQGMDTQLMSGDATVTAEFWSITGPSGEGALMTFSPDPRRNPTAAPVVEAFRGVGIEPEGYVLYTYGAVQAWAQAAKAAGTVDGGKVADALRAGTFQTVLGDISFDDKGDVTAPGYVVYRWSAGAYDYAATN